MAVSVPSDKRFRRAHVSPTRKRRWLSLASLRLVWRPVLIVAIAIVALYRLSGLVLSAEALTISRISVEGNTRLSKGEVLGLLDGLSGRSMVTVDLESWRKKLLESPWVADAAMRRVLPGTIVVAISEREPVAIGRLGEQLYLLDQHANVVDEYGPNYAEFDLPIIDGLASGRPGGTLVDPQHAALAMRVLAAMQARPDLLKRMSQIDVADTRDAAVILKDDTTLVRIGDQRFAERVQSYIDLVPTLRQHVPNIDSVDMRFDERVYVKPEGPVPAAVRTRK
jgi:cell division septal protein FtsQ